MSNRKTSESQPGDVTREQLDAVLSALDSAEQRLASMERQLQHTERLATMGTLVGSVAHEFNNILTPIMSYAQLALSEPGDAELTRKALERAYQGAERAARVASTMLGFSRNADEPSACLVDDALEVALETARLDTKHERITLEQEIAGSLCAGIAGLSLQQVLINLLLNARHAIVPEGGTIRVVGERSTWNIEGEDRPTVVLRVSDTGCGIDDDTLATLFTPYQTGPTRSGSGLGLSICKRLVERSGGRISVETMVGEGSTFVIELPEGDSSLLKRPISGASAA